jgi:hypothetical protein
MSQQRDLGPVTPEEASFGVGLFAFMIIFGMMLVCLAPWWWLAVFVGVPLTLFGGIGFLLLGITVAKQAKVVKEAKAERKREQAEREIILAAKWFRD